MAQQSVTDVGFVGIGKIGLPMANCLHRAGYRVRAVDVSTSQVDEANARGMSASTDLATLAGCRVVVAMVMNKAQLRDLLAAAPFSTGELAGSVLIAMSTVGPQAIHDLEDLVGPAGIRLVDCPVTGGIDRAETAQLTLFVAGSGEVVAEVTPVLQSMGSLVDCGTQPGNGQAFKLVNNMLAATHLVAAAEAIGFAARLGLDFDKLLPALNTGTASSWILSDRGVRLSRSLEQEFDPSIYLDIFVKDSGLVVDTANALGYNAPLSVAMRDQWKRAADQGLGRQDDTAIIKLYRSLAAAR